MDIVILCHISYCQNKRIIWKVNWKLEVILYFLLEVQNP